MARKRLGANDKVKPRNLIAVTHLYAQYKYRARNRGLVWNLSLIYFQELLKRDCIYCGKSPQNLHRGKLGHRFYYQGIDRVINDEGYTENNTVPCCIECNAVKSNILTASEMLAAMRVIKKLRK